MKIQQTAKSIWIWDSDNQIKCFALITNNEENNILDKNDDDFTR